MKLSRIAIGGAAGMMGLGLIGVGAHAAFTTSTASSQQVTAGTLRVVFSTNGGLPGTGTTALTLPSQGPTGSSFVASTQVTVKNTGTIVAKNVKIGVTAALSGTATKSGALESQMWACLTAKTGATTAIVFNEPLTTAIGYGTVTVGGTITVNTTESYTLTLYAGSTDAGCGAAFTGVNSGQWTDASHHRGTRATTKNTATPPASGLSNSAEGGIVTPTVTVHYDA